MSGRMAVSCILAESAMLKKSGKRRAESGGGRVRKYSRQGNFLEGFFEQLGRIVGASRLQIGEARGEEAGGRLREGFDELTGRPRDGRPGRAGGSGRRGQGPS